jgi:glycosyltransferase involved in cell wall biosynthesis
MAHILFVYKQFPAPSVGHAGGESLFGLMEALHRRGHKLTLVARILDEERAQLPAVQAICEHVYTVPHHRAMPGPRLLAMVRSYMTLRREARRVVRVCRPDLVHVETTQTALALVGVRLPPASIRAQDVNWFLQQQQAARSRGIKRLAIRAYSAILRVVEPALYRRYDLILAISAGDKALLAPTRGRRDLDLLPLAPAVSLDSNVLPAISSGPTLLFVGAMSRTYNVVGVHWFLDHVWPRVLAAIPDARFYVVGGSPPPDLRARADGEHCFVTGYVDDLAPWYRAATVFVSPLRVAGGLLQKIVDAMAVGVPVVATDVCNYGLGATPGEHLMTAEAPGAFAEAVVALLRDADARVRVGTAGQRFIQTHYDSESAIARWDAALLKLLHP